MIEPPRQSSVHPRSYRRSIVAVAMLAIATWWGIGLPYSLFAWLLDAQQRSWTLICYLWEVPAFGIVGLVVIPQLLWRDIERRWTAIESPTGTIDNAAVVALERKILDYPLIVAVVLLITSVIGYGLGALQIRWFAQLPFAEAVKVCLLGLVTGLVGALFAYLYLEWRLAPLLRYLPIDDASAPTTGRRVPLSAKVFSCSLVLTITVLLLLGTIFYSRGERILEEEVGRRVQAEARHLADDLAQHGIARARDPEWWHARETRMELGPSGHAFVVTEDGNIVGGSTSHARLADEGFRPGVVARVLRADGGHLVDRVYLPRIVAFASLAAPPMHVVAVVHRAEFARELEAMLRRGGLVFVMALLLTLLQGYLFSHRITRPIEIVTQMASDIARAPAGSWAIVPVRTNDEVGELANAFNRMTARLEQARGELESYSADLERRVAEATRNIATLYDVTRTTTSTIELDVVLKLVVEKIMTALDLPRLVLLWHPPDLERAVDAYTTASGSDGGRLELGETVDLTALCPAPHIAAITTRTRLGSSLPESIARVLSDPDVLCLPLVFKNQFLGLVLASLDSNARKPNLELAGALASQAAAALANAGLFETARRHEAELRKLSQVRVQLQEESLRSLSRELHDGVGQVLTAIKMDLGMIERATTSDPNELRASVREAREQVTELLQEVRTMSQLLRPSMLDDFGLVPTLQWLAEKFTARTSIVVDLRTPPTETRLPPAIEVLLYRVTQEALTNVVKHARASHVDVAFEVRDAEAALTIADDGVGFDVERFRRTPAAGGVGLLGMRERVAYYRGRIEFRSRPDAGMRISLTIPIDGPTDTEHGEGGRMTSVG
ncbi:MAG: histidine kinase [Candidatus Binatia bacterium]